MKNNIASKTKSTILISSGILLIFFFGSCNHFFYAPTVHHAALLEKKNEIVVNAGIGSADQTNFANVNLAYGIGNKVGIYGQYYSAKHNNKDNPLGNGNYMDLGLGYFGAFKASKWRYEAIAGFGGGNVHNAYDSGSYINNKFIKPYIQGNIGYRSKYFTFAFCLRGAYVSQTEVTEYKNSKYSSIPIFDALNDNRTHIAIEPGIYISGGTSNIKLQLGLGQSSLLNIGKSKTTYPYQKSFVSLGIRINFTAAKN